MAKKVSIEFAAKAEELIKQLKQMQERLEKIKSQSSGIGKGFKGLGKIVRGVGKRFKGLGLILKGIGIGLFVDAWLALKEAFQQNQTAADAFGQVGVVLQGVLNGIISVAEPLIEAFTRLFTEPKALLEDLLERFKVFGSFIFDQTIGRVLNALETAFVNISIVGNRLQKTFNKLIRNQEGVASAEADIAELQQRKLELAEKTQERNEKVRDVVNNVKQAVKETVEQVGEQVKKTARNAEILSQAEDAMRRMEIEQQRILESKDREAETQRQIRDDVSKDLDERIAANQALGKIIEEQALAEKETVQERIRVLKLQNQLLGNQRERNLEILALETEIEAIDAKITGFKSEQLVNETALKQEQSERLGLAAEGELEVQRIQTDGLDALETNEFRKLQIALNRIDKEKEAEIKLLRDKQAIYAENTLQYQEFQNQIDAVEATSANTRAQIEQQLAQAKLATTLGAIGQLKGALGENTKAAKALGIAEAVINTYTGATQALKNPFPLNLVALAGTLAAGFAQVKGIAATNAEGESSAPSPASTPSPTALAPNVQIAGGGVDPQQQLLGAVNEQLSKPSRSYVVGSDVSSQQALDRRIQQNATFGG